MQNWQWWISVLIGLLIIAGRAVAQDDPAVDITPSVVPRIRAEAVVSSEVGAYIRTGPGIFYEPAGEVEYGARFVVLESAVDADGDTWYEIQLSAASDSTAWISHVVVTLDRFDDVFCNADFSADWSTCWLWIGDRLNGGITSLEDGGVQIMALEPAGQSIGIGQGLDILHLEGWHCRAQFDVRGTDAGLSMLILHFYDGDEQLIGQIWYYASQSDPDLDALRQRNPNAAFIPIDPSSITDLDVDLAGLAAEHLPDLDPAAVRHIDMSFQTGSATCGGCSAIIIYEAAFYQ